MLKPQPPGIPLPQPSQIGAPYWKHLNTEGELWVQQCQDCGNHVFIPQHFCDRCYSGKLEWRKSSAKGVVYSYSTIYRPQAPAFTELPYVVAIVELEEGWHMFSCLINMELEDVRIGLPVKLHPVKMSESITLPYFEPL